MTNAGFLHLAIRDKHETLHDKPFLLHYKNNVSSVADHFLHLQQLYAIYVTLEIKLTRPTCQLRLPPDLSKFLLCRSRAIADDLSFIKTYCPQLEMRELLPSTLAYVAYLESISPEKTDELLAHFAVRVFGDLYGGQKIKNYVDKAYDKEEIQKKGSEGIAFYTFENHFLINFSQWFNELRFNGDTMTEEANKSCEYHAAIFDELEKYHTETKPKPKQVEPNCYGLFTKRNALLAGTGIAAVASVAVCLASL